MASAAVSSLLLPHPATLCPPPLQLHKRARRTTFRRRILRKSTNSRNQPTHGPLDDIIAEIKSDIRESPSSDPVPPIFLSWTNPLKAASTWAVTPLPVSRAPSDQPLTIRKNRNSRSSASGSSMGDPMHPSRNNSQEETLSGRTVGTPPLPGTIPWPLFDDTCPHETTPSTNHSNATICTEHTTAQQSLEKAIERKEGQIESAKQRRPSRLRLFTNGFPRLRRTGTEETSASTGDVSNLSSPTTTTMMVGSEGVEDYNDTGEPSDEAVVAYMRKNAHE
jgi:hypothetical protein